MPVVWEGVEIDIGYRLDLLVEDSIIVELKSVYQIALIHRVQLLTYLRLSKKPLGLLLNFGKAHLRDGIVRIINSPSVNPCDLCATSALKNKNSEQPQFFDNAEER